MSETIDVSTSSGTMPVYEARPPVGAPQGAIVVLHEGFGVDEHITEIARRFADVGYIAGAPNLFHRADPSPVPYTDPSAASHRERALTREQALEDVDAVLDKLAQDGWSPEQIGIVGYGVGGGVAFAVAATKALGAAVSLYPLGVTGVDEPRLAHLPDDAARLQTPWLAMYGANDEKIPPEQVDEIRELLAAGEGAFSEIVCHPRAGHGFHCDMRPSYVHDAAYEAWQRTIEWLERRLEPPRTRLAEAFANRAGPSVGYP